MIFEAETISRLNRLFLGALTKSQGAHGRSQEFGWKREPTNEEHLLACSEKLSELLRESAPSFSGLDSTRNSFDLMAAEYSTSDWYGERLEICSTLAFIGWRHSNALGLEIESQEWLRVSDVLVREDFAAIDCIESFLKLPAEEQTTPRAVNFLSRPEDVFLALACVRRDRNVDTPNALRAATTIYETCREARSLAEGEKAFFLGEAAWIAGNACRYLGRQSEASKWLKVSTAHFGKCPAGAPLLAKVNLNACVQARDEHNLERARRDAIALREQFVGWHMLYEAAFCSLLECLIDNEAGHSGLALSGLEQVVEELRQFGSVSLLACALHNLAALVAASGDMDRAEALFGEAAAAASGSPIMESSVLFSIADCHFQVDDLNEAIRWSQMGISKAVEGGCTGVLAYRRVWFAEVLLHADRVEEARQQLVTALPVLTAERMLPEGVHAAKLMSEISSRNRVDDSASRNRS